MAELHVSKQSISKLFKEMQNRKFIIPDFQRLYQWDIEKCETLWNDIVNFAENDAKEGSDYFLGTIVSNLRSDNDLEIIDGQQRITTLFLLLRAFYTKLEGMPEDDDVIGLKNQVSPCIWDINPISQKISDKTKFHIKSLVATEENTDIFHKILETGDCNVNNKDHYSENYRFFKGKSDDYAKNNPMQWKRLCITILHQCIILPIECNAPETALTIFSTLNDRGLPLSDADIFKAQIYRYIADRTKCTSFTDNWKELTHICEQANIPIDDVFRYYTHQLRAKDENKSREVGLRKFYAEKNYFRLQDEQLMFELMALAYFWHYIKENKEPDNNNCPISTETRKYLHCLFHYPNEYWKYPVCVFFLNNKDSKTFESDFCKMLKRWVAFLFAKYIEDSSVNAVKDNVYVACITLQRKSELSFLPDSLLSNFPKKKEAFADLFNENSLKDKINSNSIPKLTRGLLLLDAYLHPNQKDLITNNFDIEHIFPRQWQNTNYNGWDQKDAESYLERFGNKIIFEKKLNIQAGNGYFGKKKAKYIDSKIACVQELAQYPKNDWIKEDIEKREKEFIERIIGFFKLQLS